MRRLIVTATVLVAALSRAAWSSDGNAFDRQTLDTARALAGLDRANLPMTLTSVLPASASPGAEAWTFYAADGNAERIFVYTGSDMFRCASWPLVMRQCVIRLASVLVHEAWHFERGRGEAEAYEAQIAFLMRNGAATEHVTAVRLAQQRVRAAEAKRRSPSGSAP
jgi:hypothetical protein